MELRGKRVVVTGGGSGIGRALAVRFAEEGAHEIVVADVDADAAARVAGAIDGTAARVDVSREDEVVRLVEVVERRGPIDLFCSNAGVLGSPGGPEVPDPEWDLIWRVNVMAHVWAARALVPRMLARGEGYLLSTASAAGLLANPGLMAYSVSKHAAVAVAEWLAITYGAAGIRVSCLCPNLVDTPMASAIKSEPRLEHALAAAGEMATPEAVAGAVVDAIRREEFLILPHAEVKDYAMRRATDHERWLAGMRRFRAAWR